MPAPDFTVQMATTDADLHAAQRLRYDVFVSELQGNGPMVDHDQRLEQDHFDPYFEHMLLCDRARGADISDQVVGVYRLLTEDGAARAGQFYSESEYDLSALRATNRRLLELGRSCLHRDYRGGTALFHLWNALAQYIAAHEIDILFGVASFPGTDVHALSEPLSLLHHRHLAPQHIRTRVLAEHRQPLAYIPEAEIDRRRAMVQVPALIKAYLRLGGGIGDGAFVDHAFHTTDVCLILDIAQMNEKQKQLYTADRG